MKVKQGLKSTPLMKKIFRWAAISVVVYTVSGFIIIPPVIKSFMSKKLSDQLHREVFIQDIDLNPYALSLHVKNFVMKDRVTHETFFTFSELYINLQIVSVFEKGLILRDARIVDPYINITRNEDKLYNFSDLLKGDESEPGSESATRFSVNNIQILNGSIDFLDSPKNTMHKTRDITLAIPMISNLAYYLDSYVQPAFKATVNGTPFILVGRTKPFSDSLETVLELDIQGFNLPYYLAYIPYNMNSRIVSGTVDTKNIVKFIQYRDRPYSMTISGDISFHNLMAVDNDDNQLVHIPIYTLKNAEIDFTGKEVTIGEVYSGDGTIDVKRYKDGTFNLQRLLPGLAEKTAKAAKEKEETPWVVNINKLAYENYTIKAEDGKPADPVTLVAGQISLKAENVSTKKDSRGSLSYTFKLNETGMVSAESSFGINPLATDVRLSLKEIDIMPFQPYITDKIKILITEGAVSTEGNLSYETSEEGGFAVHFDGEASIANFSSVDKANTNEFLKWKSLYFGGVSFDYDPLRLTIGEVALSDFYSRLIVNPDGTLNVQGIVMKDKEQAEGTVPEEIGDYGVKKKKDFDKQVKINMVTLQNGNINFSDRHIKPEYFVNLLQIGGRISGLSSEEGTLADLYLMGKLENHSTLEIKGEINPLREDLFLNLKFDFKDMDLSPLTPYAHKFVGYTIQKGKLSLDLQYLIENKRLDARNNLFLDQFALGEKVESPDATKLPVKLAISLLKNSKGEIALDLPVTGEINDPEFSIGGIVIRMLVNILVKAATSPFALLGEIAGGGEELSYIEFDYGNSDIGDEEKTKLDKLVNALADRPSLKIEIKGYVDIEKDTEVLREYAFDKKLKAQKLTDMVKKGREVLPVDELNIEPEEYEKYLKRAYKIENFPKPRNVFGLAKKLPIQEMEKMIHTYIEINDDDLRSLASKRALHVKEYFLKSGKIDPKRIFLAEPESIQPEGEGGFRKSSVVFKLE